MKLKPAGIILGLAGNVALAWGLYHLLGVGSCGGEYPPCPASAAPYVIAVPVGIVASVIAIFLGGGPLIFLGLFTAVGIGSILRGINGGVGPEGDTVFAFVFGGFFLVPALLPLLLKPFTKRKAAEAARLVAEGRRGIGTVTSVEDTNVTINNNPRVRVMLSIQPEDGGAPFEASKTMTVSRVDIPRPGDAYPVWYDPQNPSKFGIGTAVEAHAPADVRALFAKAERAEGAAPAPASAPAGVQGTLTPGPIRQDWVSELGRLNDLRLAGGLTDDEFNRAKEKLLAGSPPAPAGG